MKIATIEIDLYLLHFNISPDSFQIQGCETASTFQALSFPNRLLISVIYLCQLWQTIWILLSYHYNVVWYIFLRHRLDFYDYIMWNIKNNIIVTFLVNIFNVWIKMKMENKINFHNEIFFSPKRFYYSIILQFFRYKVFEEQLKEDHWWSAIKLYAYRKRHITPSKRYILKTSIA